MSNPYFTHLSNENCPMWRGQSLKLFSANGFTRFLDGSNLCLIKTIISATHIIQPNALYNTWTLTQNLAAAIYSPLTVSLCSLSSNLFKYLANY